MLTIILITMVVLLLLGFPMMIPLLVGTMLMLLLELDFLSHSRIVNQMISGVKPVVLAAVPMFILAADIMTKGRTANRLLDLVSACVGHLRGGLPITTAVSCTLFGAVSGSTQATVVAMGGPMRPRLLQKGYKDSFALALIINASDIALLIPPSIGMIVYGVVSNTSVGQLFIAGILPGLLILVMFSIYCWIGSRLQGVEPEERVDWRGRLRALRLALLPLGFPIIVVGGIYTGTFSPIEASAIAVLYALFMELIVFRSISFRDLWAIALSTGLITAVGLSPRVCRIGVMISCGTWATDIT